MNPNPSNVGYCPVCGVYTDNWTAHLKAHNVTVLPQPQNRAERRAAQRLARRSR
jgi:hypothetical protein